VGEGRTGADTGADQRLTLRQAAARLGVSESAIRKRVERGTLRSDKGPDGKRYVYLDLAGLGAHGVADRGVDTSATHERDALISELRSHNATLREQLELEREANRENRRIIAALTSRIPELPAAQEQTQERRESPETPSEPLHRDRPFTDEEREPQEAAQPRSWWRRMFGG
jgi:hypothetical protein